MKVTHTLDQQHIEQHLIIGCSIFLTAKQISSSLARIRSTDNTNLLPSLVRGLKPSHLEVRIYYQPKISIISQKYLLSAKNIYYQPKISINRHGLLLRLREVNIDPFRNCSIASTIAKYRCGC